jgi:predicted membrane protein
MMQFVATLTAAVCGFLSAIIAISPLFGIIDFWTAMIVAVFVFVGSITSILGIVKMIEFKKTHTIPTKFSDWIAYIRRK